MYQTPEELMRYQEVLGPTMKVQRDASRNAFENKKQIFRDRLLMYTNIDVGPDKVREKLMRTVIMDAMVLEYDNQTSAKFYSQNIFDYEETDDLNNVAENDYEEMNMDAYDYFNKWNKYFYGVGIRLFLGWDDVRQTPKYKVINPLYARPDPDGGITIDTYDYYGFECVTDIPELLEYGITNTDIIQGEFSTTDNINKSAMQEGRAVATSTTNNADKGKVVVYYHYMMYRGNPIITMRYKDTLLCVRPIVPLMQPIAHKAGKFPIVLNYMEPFEGDPFGRSIPDIVEDDQRLMQLLRNLKRIKAMNQALGGKTFIERSILTKNKTALAKNTIGRQFIGVDSLNGNNIANSIFTMPEEQISADVYNLGQEIMQKVQYNTRIDAQSRGMQTSKSQTATESEIIQNNSNVGQLFNHKINNIGEKQFWTLWYLWYYTYFDSKSKKFATINKGLRSVAKEFVRKDFIREYIPNITVKSKVEIEAEEEKERLYFFNAFATMMADPSTPEVSKRFLKRKYLRLSKSKPSEIEIEAPLMPDEVQAKQDLDFLNRNVPVPVDDMNDDHLTYIIIYRTGMPTKANKEAIDRRIQAYIQSGQASAMQQQQQMMQSQAQGQANSANNTMTAMNMQAMAPK